MWPTPGFSGVKMPFSVQDIKSPLQQLMRKWDCVHICRFTDGRLWIKTTKAHGEKWVEASRCKQASDQWFPQRERRKFRERQPCRKNTIVSEKPQVWLFCNSDLFVILRIYLFASLRGVHILDSNTSHQLSCLAVSISPILGKTVSVCVWRRIAGMNSHKTEKFGGKKLLGLKQMQEVLRDVRIAAWA